MITTSRKGTANAPSSFSKCIDTSSFASRASSANLWRESCRPSNSFATEGESPARRNTTTPIVYATSMNRRVRVAIVIMAVRLIPGKAEREVHRAHAWPEADRIAQCESHC